MRLVAGMPLLWVTGVNDFAYPLDSLQCSYRLPSVRGRCASASALPHDHGAAGENPEETRAFADSLLRDGPPLPKIVAQDRDGQTVRVSFASATPVVQAELVFTRTTGPWQDRLWESLPASLFPDAGLVEASLPEDVTVYYLNLTDVNGLASSSEPEGVAHE